MFRTIPMFIIFGIVESGFIEKKLSICYRYVITYIVNYALHCTLSMTPSQFFKFVALVYGILNSEVLCYGKMY